MTVVAHGCATVRVYIIKCAPPSVAAQQEKFQVKDFDCSCLYCAQ